MIGFFVNQGTDGISFGDDMLDRQLLLVCMLQMLTSTALVGL